MRTINKQIKAIFVREYVKNEFKRTISSANCECYTVKIASLIQPNIGYEIAQKSKGNSMETLIYSIRSTWLAEV